MVSQLDFRHHGNIPSKYIKLWNQIAYETHRPFTVLIDSLSRQHGKSIDWWVSSPASRNTLTSPLFHYCCCIALLQKLTRMKEPVSEIITDSRAFKKIVDDYLAGHYISTPYSYVPKIGRKLTSDYYTDIGQGLLECLHLMAEND